MRFGIWDQKRSSSWGKKREILASFNGCLFQSQTPESNTEHCPGFVLSLAGCRLAMLTLAMWLCASAFRVAQWKRVWMLRTLRFINIRNETTKSTQIINVVILKNAFYFLDYAISLVRADWKGLDSLAAGRESAGCFWFVWMLEKLKAIHHRGYLQRIWIWHVSYMSLSHNLQLLTFPRSRSACHNMIYVILHMCKNVHTSCHQYS